MTTILNRLIPTQQPALILAPNAYARSYHDALNNIFRLYFSQIDNVTTNLSTNAGGRFLGFPNIAAQYNDDQYTTDNTATKVKWDSFDSQNGFLTAADTVVPPVPVNNVRAQYTGVYKIDYSLQFANTNTQEHTAYVWLEINGVGVPGSASKFTVPSKHGGGDGYVVAYSSIVFEVEAGDEAALYWATDVARVLPSTNGVYMEHYDAQTTPFIMPSIPSAIGCITFVSTIPA